MFLNICFILKAFLCPSSLFIAMTTVFLYQHVNRIPVFFFLFCINLCRPSHSADKQPIAVQTETTVRQSVTDASLSKNIVDVNIAGLMWVICIHCLLLQHLWRLH